MRAALTRAKPDLAHLTIITVNLTVVVTAALLSYVQLVRVLDDAIISVILTLTALLAFVTLGSAMVRKRP